ncbi:MAG TPA: DUF1801 domain-containing protein [Actinomycetota bacterium]|nr:DUF1801 domain-containing protein [Actinomycetota bacterium]
MAEKAAKKSPKGAFSAEERAAMKDLARERKRVATEAELEKEVLAAIAKLPEPDRGMAKRLHTIIKAAAPELTSKTWYGMPAYAKDDKVVCFFKPASKFKQRYSTFGFEEKAKLDEGNMWVTSFALTGLTPAEEKKISALVKKAAR